MTLQRRREIGSSTHIAARRHGYLCPLGELQSGDTWRESRKTESDQAVLDGEARSRCPRAHSQLAVDGAEVLAHGAGAEVEPLGYLGVGQSLGHERKDLGFALGE